MVTQTGHHLHQDQPIFTSGVPLEKASTALIMLHGRGASAQDILSLAQELGCSDCAYLAPQAKDLTWYPYPFLAPIAQNEPWLSSALEQIDSLFAQIREAGLEQNRIGLLGFSQGASLSLEYTIRHPQRYRAVIGLSGGIIGPPGTTWDYPGSFDGTPVFLGCSDKDPYIPKERVDETARLLKERGAKVTERIYSNMGHEVNMDEIQFVRDLLVSK